MLTGLALALLALGLLVLNRACALALVTMSPEQVPTYRALFYQRAALGIGCIVLGAVLLRKRRPAENQGSKSPRGSQD